MPWGRGSCPLHDDAEQGWLAEEEPEPAAAEGATAPPQDLAGVMRWGRFNDAPCPPFTSHGASILLQYLAGVMRWGRW
jgi:hypothetical protein